MSVLASDARTAQTVSSSGSVEITEALRRSTRWVISGAVAAKILQVGGNAVVVRLITPDALGLFTLTLFMVTIAQTLSDFGIGWAMLQHPEEDAQRSGFTILLGLGLLAFALVLLFGHSAALVAGDVRIAPLLRVLALRLLVAPLVTLANVRLTRKLRYAEVSSTTVAAGLAGTCTAIGFAYLGAGVWALVAGDLSTLVFQCLLLWRLAGARPTVAMNSAHARILSTFGFFVVLETLIGGLIVTVDGFMLGRLHGPETLGFYRLGLTLGLALILTITGPLTGVVFAGLSRLTADARAFEAALVDAMRLMVHMNAAWAGVLIPCSALVVQTAFGQKWTAAAPIVALFAAYGALAAAGMVPPQAYRALGRPRINVMFLATQLVVAVPAFAFAARRGALPLAGVQLIQGAVFSVVNVVLCSRVLAVPLRRLGRAVVTPLSIGVGLAVWNFALSSVVVLDTAAFNLALHLVTSALLWGTLLYTLDRHGWIIFRQLLTRT